MGKFIGKVIPLRDVLLSFPELEEAVPYTGGGDSNGTKSFQASFVLDPNNSAHASAYAEVEAEVERAIKETWDGNRPSKLKVEFFGEGNDRTSAQTGAIYKGYEDMQWVTAKSQEDSPPMLKDKAKLLVLRDPAEALGLDPATLSKKKLSKIFYGGVHCNATINVYVAPLKFLRICCGLRGIMSLERGDPFGAGVKDSEFDDFDSEDDDGVGAPDDDGLGDDPSF
jgi:hypothetical protein